MCELTDARFICRSPSFRYQAGHAINGPPSISGVSPCPDHHSFLSIIHYLYKRSYYSEANFRFSFFSATVAASFHNAFSKRLLRPIPLSLIHGSVMSFESFLGTKLNVLFPDKIMLNNLNIGLPSRFSSRQTDSIEFFFTSQKNS